MRGLRKTRDENFDNYVMKVNREIEKLANMTLKKKKKRKRKKEKN